MCVFLEERGYLEDFENGKVGCVLRFLCATNPRVFVSFRACLLIFYDRFCLFIWKTFCLCYVHICLNSSHNNSLAIYVLFDVILQVGNVDVRGFTLLDLIQAENGEPDMGLDSAESTGAGAGAGAGAGMPQDQGMCFG